MALALGRTVAELGATLSSSEMSEWQAFELIEPFGERRADERARLLGAIAAGCAPDELLKTYEPEEAPLEAAEAKLLAQFEQLAAAQKMR